MTAPAVPIEEGASFDEAYRALAESERYQTDLPMTEIEPPEMPAWLEWLIGLFEGTGGFWQFAFWAVVVVVVIALLIVLARRAGILFAKKPTEDSDAEALRPDEQPARALLDEADRLAEKGRYAEAAHLLLFRSLEDIDRRLPDLLSPALTSRDIARSDGLPDTPRSAFAEIARIVERGIFAVRPVEQSGWRDARAAYERFAFGEWA